MAFGAPTARGGVLAMLTLAGGIYAPMVTPNVAKSIFGGELINDERCS